MVDRDKYIQFLEEKERWARKKKHNYRPFDDNMFHYYEGLEEAYHNALVYFKYDF